MSHLPCPVLPLLGWLVLHSLVAFPQTSPPNPSPPLALSNQPTLVSPEFVNQISEHLRAHHPALRAANARVRAAHQDTLAVRSWDDPRLRLGGMISESAMRQNDGDLLYGVEQDLPLFGRPAAARRLAEANLDTSVADENLQFQIRRRDLAIALFRAALADRVVDIATQDLRWIEDTLATAESRYRVGEGIQAQILRLQNELALRQNSLITDQQRRDQSRVVLNRLLGNTNHLAWPVLLLPEPAGPVPFNDRLVRLSLNNEPRRRLLLATAASADRQWQLTRRSRLPSVSLGAETRLFSGSGDFRQAMLQLSLSLPWFNAHRYRSEARRDAALRDAAQLDVLDYELALRTEIHLLTVEIDAARRRALTYRHEILPRSEQALASATSAWTSSRTPFLEVIEARRLLLDARLEYARAVAEQFEWLSDLALCCGIGDLEALQMIDAQPAPSPSSPPIP